MHIAMRLEKGLLLNTGKRLSLVCKQEGQIGMLPVFETAEAARAVYGKDCETVEVFPEAKK